MPIGKVGQRRQVVIPKEILDQPYAESRDVQLQKAIQVLGSRLVAKN